MVFIKFVCYICFLFNIYLLSLSFQTIYFVFSHIMFPIEHIKKWLYCCDVINLQNKMFNFHGKD
jgi:hypothetical protein